MNKTKTLLLARLAFDGLDDLSVDNLMCDPPRITNRALHLAMLRVVRQFGDTANIQPLTKNNTFPGQHVWAVADELNDMLVAAKEAKSHGYISAEQFRNG
jgi:hypothetical protein